MHTEIPIVGEDIKQLFKEAEAKNVPKVVWNPQVEKSFIPIAPHPKQKLFLDLDVKEALFGGATGGGKTAALLADALKYVNVSSYSALLLRRNFPDLIQEGGLISLSHEWLQNTDAKWHSQNKEWTFPSGARLRFGYLDTENDKYRYQGGEYQYIGFDELTQFSQSQYTYLFSRLRKRENANIPLRVRGGTNPGGLGGAWVYERFIPENFNPEHARELKVWEKIEQREDGSTAQRYFVPSMLEDNPSLDMESYLQSLDELDPITKAQYLKGDWLIQVKGDILYMYSEPHTVITWEEFANVFGTTHIPEHWMLEMYQDFGTTKDHPCVTSWFATAAQNSALPGAVFLYRGYVTEQATARVVANTLIELMKPRGEQSRLRQFQMSHEASSERLEYIEAGLPAACWETGRTRGVEQLKYAFTLTDIERPNPFRPTLMGRPLLFLIVDKNELINPKTDAGLVRHRAEAVAYKWAELKSGEPMTVRVPHPLFNDAIDTMRAAAANYFPNSTRLTKVEVFSNEMQSQGLDYAQIEKIEDEDTRKARSQRRAIEDRAFAQKQKPNLPRYMRIGRR
jgi:hypothetical protein